MFNYRFSQATASTVQEFSEHPGVCNDVSVFKVPPEPRSGSSFVPCASLFFNALAACWEVGKAGRKTVRERERERERSLESFSAEISQLRCSYVALLLSSSLPSSIEPSVPHLSLLFRASSWSLSSRRILRGASGLPSDRMKNL